MTLLSRLPSPATTLTVLALVVTTSGASYAAGKVTSADIVDGTIARRDVGVAADAAYSVGKAYAFVDRVPGRGDTFSFRLDKKRTSGFTRLTHPSTGVFCLTPNPRIDLARSVFVGSTDYASSAGINNQVKWNSSTDPDVRDCPLRTVEVITYAEGTDDEDENSDNVAFTVFMP